MPKDAAVWRCDDALLACLPTPLAELYRRAVYAKNASEFHQTAYYLWEASIKLLGAAAVAHFSTKLPTPRAKSPSGPPSEKWPGPPLGKAPAQDFVTRTHMPLPGESAKDDDASQAFAVTVGAEGPVVAPPSPFGAPPLQAPPLSPLEEANIDLLKQLSEPLSLMQWWQFIQAYLPEVEKRLSQWDDEAAGQLERQLGQLQTTPHTPTDPSMPTMSGAPFRPPRLQRLLERLQWYKTANPSSISRRTESLLRRMGRHLLQAWESFAQELLHLPYTKLLWVERLKRITGKQYQLECITIEGPQPEQREELDTSQSPPGPLPLEGHLYLHPEGLDEEEWIELQAFLFFEPHSQSCFFFDTLSLKGQANYIHYPSGRTLQRSLKLHPSQGALLPILGGELATPTIANTVEPEPKRPTPTNERRELPDKLGEFDIVSFLGEGGMGTVYRAVQPALGRQVALKTMQRMGSRQAEQRFHREIQALGRIDHPNLVKIYTSGSFESQWYYAMELIDGADLSHVYKKLNHQHAETISHQEWRQAIQEAQADLRGQEELREPHPSQTTASGGTSLSHEGVEPLESLATVKPTEDHVVRIVQLIKQVASATHALHEVGVVHRDIKPSNVMLTSDGANAVLMDLGLARISDAKDDTEGNLTITHQFMGTPLYASPEQCLGMGHVDRRTDIYSLGATLWELLTFRPMYDFEGKRLPEILEMIRHKEPYGPSRFNQAIPQDLEAIVMKCLEKDRDRRYATAALLAEDLDRWLAGEPVQAQPPTLAYLLGKFVNRNKGKLASAVAVVLICLVSLLGAFIWVNEARKAAINAQKEEEQARREVMQANIDLKQQKRAALRAKAQAETARKQAEKARKQAEQRRLRLLEVQQQILEERIRLLLNQKKLRVEPANAILSFFASVLEDPANPLLQRMHAVRGSQMLLRRHEEKLEQIFEAPVLMAMYKALLQALVERRPKPTSQVQWRHFRRRTAFVLLLMRHHLPATLESKQSPTKEGFHWPKHCPKQHLLDGIWLTPVQMLLRCAITLPGREAHTLLSLTYHLSTQHMPPRFFDRWEALLKESSRRSLLTWWRVKRAAIEAASHCDTPPQILLPTLERNLEHDDSRLRQTALQSMGTAAQCHPQLLHHLLPTLLEALRDINNNVQLTAIKVLGRIAQTHEQTIPAIAEAMFLSATHASGWHGLKRHDAIFACLKQVLEHFPQQARVFERLARKNIGHRQQGRRYAAAKMLRLLPYQGYTRWLPALLSRRREPSWRVRFANFRALQSITQRPLPQHFKARILAYLVKGAHDRHVSVKIAALSAIEALMRHSPRLFFSLQDHIYGALKERSSFVTNAALEVLDTFLQKRPMMLPHIAPLIVQTASRKSWRVRKTAYRIIGEWATLPLSVLSPTLFLPQSLRATQSGQITARLAAARALVQWSQRTDTFSKPLATKLTSALVSRASYKSRRAIRLAGVLAQAGPAWSQALLPQLQSLLKTRRSRTRSLVLQALAQAATQDNANALFPVFQRHLTDRSHLVRLQATKALGRIAPWLPKRHTAVVQQLIRVAHDHNRQVQQAAMLLLERLIKEGDAQEEWLPWLLSRTSSHTQPNDDPNSLALIRLATYDASLGLSFLASLPKGWLHSKLRHALIDPEMMPKLGQLLFTQTGPSAAPGSPQRDWLLKASSIRAGAASLLPFICHPQVPALLYRAFQKETHLPTKARIALSLGHALQLFPLKAAQQALMLASKSSEALLRQAASIAYQKSKERLQPSDKDHRIDRARRICQRTAQSAIKQLLKLPFP